MCEGPGTGTAPRSGHCVCVDRVVQGRHAPPNVPSVSDRICKDGGSHGFGAPGSAPTTAAGCERVQVWLLARRRLLHDPLSWPAWQSERSGARKGCVLPTRPPRAGVAGVQPLTRHHQPTRHATGSTVLASWPGAACGVEPPDCRRPTVAGVVVQERRPATYPPTQTQRACTTGG